METTGYVSLWISSGGDRDKLYAAFNERYTDDGTWIAPPFARAFGFETYDPATREISALETPASSIRAAVAGFSYAPVIGERLAREYGDTLPVSASAVALLYDFKFSGTPVVAVVDGTRWYFVGCVSCLEQSERAIEGQSR